MLQEDLSTAKDSNQQSNLITPDLPILQEKSIFPADLSSIYIPGQIILHGPSHASFSKWYITTFSQTILINRNHTAHIYDTS